MERMNIQGKGKLTRVSTGETYPAEFPGDIFSILIKNKVIPDPYAARNETEVQWVGREDWQYSIEFTVSSSFLTGKNCYIELKDLDTIAEIYINNRLVGRGDNAFVTYFFPADTVNPGRNMLTIIIRSPETAAEHIAQDLPYPVPFMSAPIQSPHRNLIRKPQCHGGWDWGPSLMTGGIYSPVNLISFKTHYIKQLYTQIEQKSESTWQVDIKLDIVAVGEKQEELSIILAEINKNFTVSLQRGENTLHKTIFIEDPVLWWPAGYGEQQLYRLEVKTSEGYAAANIGFRKLEVITENDSFGTSLQFRVNGRNIFCKGANWIPLDALPARQTLERYEYMLSSMAETNMNMVRVWGGGQYEKDIFYDLCDQKGILVWQDFMFSCSLYPSNTDFLSNVKQEVIYQLKRLMNHPAIALWCGNNEDIGALTWFKESRLNRDRYIIDYDRLNEGIIGTAVKTLDPTRKWWPSSPSSGEGDYSDNWHNDSKGDMHYWNVWHEGAPFEDYRKVIPRFCSEFGYQSFPGIKTIKTFSEKDQMNISSPTMLHHQKNLKGNEIILSSLARYFRFPETFEDLLYLSQVQQVYAVRTAVEYWRSKKPVCSGILYWQLNDNWPGASWSSIDYTGEWKLLHYAAKDFYNPVHITGFPDATDKEILGIYGINDTDNHISANLDILQMSFDGEIIKRYSMDISISKDSSKLLFSLPVPKNRFEKENSFLYFSLTGGGVSRENYFFFTTPNMCSLKKGIYNENIEISGNKAVVKLSVDKPAFFIFPESGIEGSFSDRGFFMVPGKEREIVFTMKEACTKE
ncbi:MAG: glycoside hydrolase family 2 protein, partial [Spirochaetes bacterium]